MGHFAFQREIAMTCSFNSAPRRRDIIIHREPPGIYNGWRGLYKIKHFYCCF
jgi:hypothetical protein